MPRKTGKSGLAAKLGQAGRGAFDGHKGDQTSYGGGSDLPAGIEGGVAQLTECRFSVYEKGDFVGEPFFSATGIVVSPQEYNGTPIEGLRTQIGPEPLCNTPGRENRPDMDSHMAWVLNEIRKLGINTDEIVLDDLETVVEALKEAQPYFRFRTWGGGDWENKKGEMVAGRVNHDWRGACDYNVEETSGTDDQTRDVEEGEGDESSVPFGDDLDMLADAAESGDEDARDRLCEKAYEAGSTVDAVNQAESWSAVAELIRTATEVEEEPEAGETVGDEDWEPNKGDVYGYTPKGKRKPIECEVTAVYVGKRTVNLKDLDTEKLFKSVPWDKLKGE